jgi:hypothetical protein
MDLYAYLENGCRNHYVLKGRTYASNILQGVSRERSQRIS